MSTNYSGKFALSNFLNVEQIIRISNGIPVLEKSVNYLDPRVTRLLRAIRTWTPHQVMDSTPITTVAYKYYGSTTAWWIIASYNGIIHPLAISPGTILKIPNLFEINAQINNVTSRVGQVIEI